MNFQTLGDKAGFVNDRVRNDESSATMALGTPVCLSLDGTEDGLAVLLPSSMSSQALADSFFYGVVQDAAGIAAAHLGNVQKHGISNNAKVLRATRSDDSANWVGSTSIAKGVLLSLDTVNNVFSTDVGSVTFASNTTVSMYPGRSPYAFLAQSIASFASTNSTATSYGTKLTVAAKVFLRSL